MASRLLEASCRLLAKGARLWWRTLPVRILTHDDRTYRPAEYPFDAQIFAISERDLLVLPRMTDETRFTALIATGRDGDLATAAAEALGLSVVRGSSRRAGHMAFSELVRALERNAGPAAIVVDGPLGPAGEPKPGVLACAAATGRCVVPVGAAARRAIVLTPSWSKLYLPLPFTEVVIVCGAPIPAPPRGRAARAELLDELRAALTLARSRALEACREPRRGLSRAARATIA
jgi:lysophospholipid acyltransferase (LPLAT)-like uncharacterized protein